jgi:hypothetical protein
VIKMPGNLVNTFEVVFRTVYYLTKRDLAHTEMDDRTITHFAAGVAAEVATQLHDNTMAPLPTGVRNDASPPVPVVPVMPQPRTPEAMATLLRGIGRGRGILRGIGRGRGRNENSE